MSKIIKSGLLFFILISLACQQEEKDIYNLIQKRVIPEGAPIASDVIMRSLGLHPSGPEDEYDTMKAMDEFHVTRLEWSYITDQEFIQRVKESGRVFGGAVAAPSFDQSFRKEGWFEENVVVNLKGEPVFAPWKRTWNQSFWACINKPTVEKAYMAYLKEYIDAGADVMQRDEPGANMLATKWGACFCPDCMNGFRNYLEENTTTEEQKEMTISNIETFNYKEYLLSIDAPVGDAFRQWDGGKLKELFVEFQEQSSIAFHQRTRKAINEYAGRNVPMSCNNGARRWTPIEMVFDWTFGELSYRHATPDFIYNAMQEAKKRNRIQVVTMPKKGNYENPEEWHRLTRKSIAMAYACGGYCMVPWDTFMPNDAPRYFGTPEQYADLFGFIRANADYLDRYEEALATGKGFDKKESNDNGLVIEHPDISAIVRVLPDPSTPIVIHLINWGEADQMFQIKLSTSMFGKKIIPVLYTVPEYDQNAHEQAEATNDYSVLTESVKLESSAKDEFISVNIQSLGTWGLLVLE